jgi:hypothetical protein
LELRRAPRGIGTRSSPEPLALGMAELAEAAGVTPRTVHRLEIGGEQHVAKKNCATAM